MCIFSMAYLLFETIHECNEGEIIFKYKHKDEGYVRVDIIDHNNHTHYLEGRLDISLSEFNYYKTNMACDIRPYIMNIDPSNIVLNKKQFSLDCK